MRLTYFPNVPIEVSSDKPTIIQTNNVSVMTDLTCALRDMNDKVKLTDDKFSAVDISKGIYWIGDPFLQVDLNKLFESALQKKLMEDLDDGARSKLFEIDKELKTVILDSSFGLKLPLVVRNEFEPQKLIKQ